MLPGLKVVVGLKVKVYPIFYTAFKFLFNVIGDICERTCGKVHLHVANKLL